MKELSPFEQDTKIMIYICSNADKMQITEQVKNVKDWYPFATHPANYTRTQIGDIVKALDIKDIYLPSENQGSSKLFARSQNVRDFKVLYQPGMKKLIFLIRRTGGVKYMRALKKTSMIILAKTEGVKILPYMREIRGKTMIMAFSDSDEMTAFKHTGTAMEKEKMQQYSPLIVSMKGIRRFAKQCDGITINPSSLDVAGKGFTMMLTTEVLEYMDSLKSEKRTKEEPQTNGTEPIS